MNHGFEVALVLAVMLVAANLPFVNERVLVVGPRLAPKHIGWRLGELLVLGLVALAVGWAVEGWIGQRAPQRWEFFAAALCLFVTLAFPGFVWRYLRRRGGD